MLHQQVQVSLVCILSWLAAASCLAIELTFTLDPAASQVGVTGYIVPVQSDAMPQGAGSDTTRFSGSLSVDVDDPFAPTSIEFLGGSASAAISGNWLPQVGGGTPGGFLPGDANPGAPQPANYGLSAQGFGIGSLWVAFRDLLLSPTSEPLPITAGQFAADQVLTLDAGSADYTVRSIIFSDMNEHIDLVGKTAANLAGEPGTYSVAGGVATLSLPVELFVEVTAPGANLTVFELTFAGSVTATATLGPPPTADFDGDGDVDGDDLLDMLLGFGTSGGATRSQGDANQDGDVDRDDFQIWRSQLDAAIAASQAAVVPEPSALALAISSIGLLFALKRQVLFFQNGPLES